MFKILFSSLLLLLFLALEKFLNNTFTLIFAGLFIFILLVLKISNKRYGFGSEFLLDLLFLLPNFAGELIINFYVGGWAFTKCQVGVLCTKSMSSVDIFDGILLFSIPPYVFLSLILSLIGRLLVVLCRLLVFALLEEILVHFYWYDIDPLKSIYKPHEN